MKFLVTVAVNCVHGDFVTGLKLMRRLRSRWWLRSWLLVLLALVAGGLEKSGP